MKNTSWCRWAPIVLAANLLLPVLPACAADGQQAEPASTGDDKLSLVFRYRYELVDQDGFAARAHASTLRTRLAYRSRPISDLQFLIEFDDVRAIGSDRYDSTRNGHMNRPVVADPEGADLNQLVISYTGLRSTVLSAGRRRIMLDDQRFVGDVGWRQNDQTYDGLMISNTSMPKTTIEYAYIDKVNRIFGPESGAPPAEFESASHTLRVQHTLPHNWEIVAYAYFLDFRNSPSSSNKTIGVRASGSNAIGDRTTVGYTMEYAYQEDHGSNPMRYNADYVFLEWALNVSAVNWKLAYELLAAHSAQAFQSPLGTLHAFQGWSDKYLTTPAAGIEDLSFSVATKIYGANVLLRHHRFNPESGGPEYGREWDLLITMAFAQRYSMVLKHAYYDARSFATDTQKVWLMFTAKFGN